MRLSGCAVVWLCGCVAVWLCGCVVVWLCGCALGHTAVAVALYRGRCGRTRSTLSTRFC